MIFRDTVLISKATNNAYGKSSNGVEHSVPAVVELTGNLRRGGYYDAFAGDARAYLDATNVFLQSVGYAINGFYLSVTKYGVEKKYRITNVAVGERFVTDGSISHIEVDLEESK